MSKANEEIKLEFYRITKIPFFDDYNNIFNSLAEKVFDNPDLLKLLTIKIKKWLRLEKNEFTYSLAGYIYYFKEEFCKAERYFIKAINLNPLNLYNWFNLAFSLYHQGEKKHIFGKKILFNFDYFIKFFKDKKVNTKNLKEIFKNYKI